jgi:hypothetical protein
MVWAAPAPAFLRWIGAAVSRAAVSFRGSGTVLWLAAVGLALFSRSTAPSRSSDSPRPKRRLDTDITRKRLPSTPRARPIEAEATLWTAELSRHRLVCEVAARRLAAPASRDLLVRLLAQRRGRAAPRSGVRAQWADVAIRRWRTGHSSASRHSASCSRSAASLCQRECLT